MSTLTSVPLLGALCVAAGLVTHEEVEECFALQHTSYPGTPIGQILVIKGYLTQIELARMVAQQQNFGSLTLRSRVPNKEFMAKVTYNFSGLAPGDYEVTTTAHDKNSPKSADFALKFTLVD